VRRRHDDLDDPFQDAALYDWEYRRRRDDVRFYSTLADERGGPIADLACGTGRIAVPLLRAGHTVIGVDRAPTMLARAGERIRRLGPDARRRALLVRGDLRAPPLARRFPFAICAFHSVQHMLSDGDLARFFHAIFALLIPGGWLAFDLFAPTARFLERATPGARRRWGRTIFRHPRSKQRLIYTESYRREDPDGTANPSGSVLAMDFHYRPVDGETRHSSRERVVRLRHRLLDPGDIRRLLAAAKLELIASWGGFDGRALDGETEQHIYLARRKRAAPAR
jgi:SAM-dependent methyltransferase